MRGRDKFNKYKKIIMLFVEIVSILPRSIRQALFNFFQMKKGISGLTIRYILIKTLAKSCGDNVSIYPNVYLFSLENLEIGDNCSIHPLSYIDATGGIEIQNDVSIAHSTTILSTSKSYLNLKEPIKDQQLLYSKTIIHENVWIGCKATILYGNEIGTGSIIGANSLVTKDVKEYSIVGGVPAKELKLRE